MFSDAWLKQFLKLWNQSTELLSLLKKEKFSAAVGYGLDGQIKPMFVLVIKSGRLEKIMRYRQQSLDWDFRASAENWKLLIENPPGISQLGLAYSQRRLTCLEGKYSLMMKNSNLSKAFSHSFKIMNQVNIT